MLAHKGATSIRIFRVAVLLACALLLPSGIGADVTVKEYTKKDGTVVETHKRTAPNNTKNDNYSTKGNINPYTGKPGTKPGDGETPTAAKMVRANKEHLEAKDPAPALRSRSELKAEIAKDEKIIDRFVRQSSFKLPPEGLVSTQQYEAAKKALDEAEGELKAGPPY